MTAGTTDAARDRARVRPSVLIVDDRAENLLALEAVLEPLDATVVRATTPEAALGAVREREFAVILLDVQMPGMDGYEVARRIKEMEASRLTPIIFVTALDQDRRHVHAGYESGAVDYLFKPLDPDVLRAKVQAFTRMYVAQEEEAWRQRRRYADLAEHEAARRAARILESIADAFYALDDRWNFTYVNQKTEELWGRRREELLGRHFWTELPVFRGSETYEKHVVAMTERRALHFETVDPLMGRWIEASVYPEVGGGIACYFRDVGERKRAEAERERLLAAEREARIDAESARAAAEGANRAKSEFLATMSHELRTPLNALLGYVDLIDIGLAGPVTEQQRAYLARLDASARHLLALVDDVLDVAKVDAGRVSVMEERALTGDAVASAIALAAPQAASRDIRLVDANAGDQGVPYLGDPHRVRQIVVNLLSNAVKFTQPGGTVTITCGTAGAPPAAPGGGSAPRLDGAGPWTFIRVDDTGIGIPPEEQERIFEPFHQVERGTTRTRGGTGLGLAISRRFARLMHGDLTVDSTPGAGSTFTLWLPPSAARLPAEPAGEQAGRRMPDLQVHGLHEVGALLRARQADVLAAYAVRLREDPLTPLARHMHPAPLEDHQVSYVADLAQSLVIIAEAGPEASDLMKDASAIQRTVAEHHGRRRHAQQWTDGAVRREYQVLGEEVERAVRAGAAGNAEEALRVLAGMIDRATEISLAAWQRAERVGQERSGWPA